MRQYRLLMLLLLFGAISYPQVKMEREHRIKKAQAPSLQIDLTDMEDHMKRARFYRETDSSSTTYRLKFKMARIHYHLDYDKNGALKRTGILVREIDIPQATFSKMQAYLSDRFSHFKIKRIWQEYPVATLSAQEVVRKTFQNLLLPSNEYKVLLVGTRQNRQEELEFWFNAKGQLNSMRRALPLNHDHVLY